MKTISATLQQDIVNGDICNVIKVTTADSTVYAYTDGNLDLTIDSVVYKAEALSTKVKTFSTANAEVSNEVIESTWFADIQEADILEGKLDFATVEAGIASWKNPSEGILVFFSGKISDVKWTDDGWRVDIQNYLNQLKKLIGTIATPHCWHQLYDSLAPGKPGACQVNSASYTFTGTVDVVLTDRWKFKISGDAATQADKYFTNGVLTFTSGANNGVSKEVKIHEVNADPNIGKSIEFFLPTFFTIEVGDTFSVKAGCDKSLDTCKNKFNNVVNFGGFPHIQPEVSWR